MAVYKSELWDIVEVPKSYVTSKKEGGGASVLVCPGVRCAFSTSFRRFFRSDDSKEAPKLHGSISRSRR